MFKKLSLALMIACALQLIFLEFAYAKSYTLLNVSYDPTRAYYEDINREFISNLSKEGVKVKILQSHGGSGKQARAVIDGLQADVVTLALSHDIDIIAKKSGSIALNWQEKYANNSCPYTSTIVFLVRKGNPKKISDWNDLIREDVKVITPNPKTSGGARWNILALWAYALEQHNNDEQKAQEFLAKVMKNVPILDTGARASTTSFVMRGLGDVLITWENEAHLAVTEIGADKVEIVYPSVSVLAEPPVAVVDSVARKKETYDVANKYLDFLYSAVAQEIAAKHHFRPYMPEVLEKYNAKFPAIRMFRVSDFGGWDAVQVKLFDDGAIFDKAYRPN